MRRLSYAIALVLSLAAANAADLTLGSIAPRVRTIVYELPGVPAEQARFLAAAVKQNFPNAEVLDATASGEAELRGKLTRTFLLVALLDAKSRLLPQVAQPLPLKLENGTVHWDDFTGPVKGLRVDFVGRNPFGSGYSIVTAVDSLALLQGNDNSQYSYAIRSGDGVLRKGTYDEDFTPTPRGRMKLADAQADLRDLFASLERVHAAPFARVAESDYRRMKEQSFADLQTRADRSGLVAVEDLAWIVRYGTAFLRDGHTESLWGAFPFQEPMDHSRFPPFRVEFENGRFYITGAIDSSLAGMELISVNGAPTAQFLRPILDRISGETLAWRATRFADNQNFWLWFSNLIGKTEGCCRLGLRDAEGRDSARTVEPVSIAKFRVIQDTAARKYTRATATTVRFFDSGKVAQFIYPGFRYSPSEIQKIGDIFRQIRENKTEDVIVDLRSNGGGEVQMGSLIFSYLSSKPAPQFIGGRIKISREAISELAGEMIAPHEGEVLTVSDINDVARTLGGAFAEAGMLPKQANPFTGRVWLLVDNRSFSAATLFSAAFQRNKIGTILGFETAQPGDICGDPVLPFTLKHSGIPYRVSASASFVKDPGSNPDEHGVLPDVPFDRKSLAAFHADPDPELAFTIDYIHKHRTP